MAIGSIVGGVANLVGSYSASKSAKASAEHAEKLMNEQLKYGQEGVDIADDLAQTLKDIGNEYGDNAHKVWGEWESMYGDLETNLTNYYSSLSPTKYATEWKSNIEKELNKQFQHFNQVASQSGIYTTGMKLQAMKERAFKQAEANALADVKAPEMVANQQSQFFGKFGMPQKMYAENLNSSAILEQANLANLGVSQQLASRNNLMTALAGASNAYSQSSAGYGTQAGVLAGRGWSMLSDGLNSLWSN